MRERRSSTSMEEEALIDFIISVNMTSTSTSTSSSWIYGGGRERGDDGHEGARTAGTISERRGRMMVHGLPDTDPIVTRRAALGKPEAVRAPDPVINRGSFMSDVGITQRPMDIARAAVGRVESKVPPAPPASPAVTPIIPPSTEPGFFSKLSSSIGGALGAGISTGTMAGLGAKTNISINQPPSQVVRTSQNSDGFLIINDIMLPQQTSDFNRRVKRSGGFNPLSLEQATADLDRTKLSLMRKEYNERISLEKKILKNAKRERRKVERTEEKHIKAEEKMKKRQLEKMRMAKRKFKHRAVDIGVDFAASLLGSSVNGEQGIGSISRSALKKGKTLIKQII